MDMERKGLFSQQAGPSLQFKRPILPIDEYAAREGVCREIIEEYRKMGIVQVRKYKDKVFVVDVPLSPYLDTMEAAGQPAQSEGLDDRDEALRQRGSCRGNLPELIPTPELEKVEITGKIEKLFERIVKVWRMPAFAILLRKGKFKLDAFGPRAWSKRVWKIIALSLLVILFAVVYANFWYRIGRKVRSSAELNGQTFSQSNTEAIERLDGQIQKLTSRLTELAENPQSHSGSGR